MARYGVFGARRERRDLAAAELERVDTIEGLDIGIDELLTSEADPQAAAGWRDQFESYKELALSHDEVQQREGLNGLSSMATAVRGAVDRRRASQQEFIIGSARELRADTMRAKQPMRELQANAEQLNELLADPDFEQNLPLNRGRLMTLLESTGRQMLTDPADMADALMRAGAGGGLVGSLISAAGGALDAQDFDFTKEDYARIARASYTFNAKRYERTVAPLELQAAALDEAAAGLDFLPRGYSLTQYVTGPAESFQNPLAARYEDNATAPAPAAKTALDALGGLLSGTAPQAAAAAESASDPDAATAPFDGVDKRDTGLVERFIGMFDSDIYDTAQELNNQIGAAIDAGGTIKANPNTGDVFAIYEDGRREALPNMTTVKRTYVRNRLKRSGPTARARGRDRP